MNPCSITRNKKILSRSHHGSFYIEEADLVRVAAVNVSQHQGEGEVKQTKANRVFCKYLIHQFTRDVQGYDLAWANKKLMADFSKLCTYDSVLNGAIQKPSHHNKRNQVQNVQNVLFNQSYPSLHNRHLDSTDSISRSDRPEPATRVGTTWPLNYQRCTWLHSAVRLERHHGGHKQQNINMVCQSYGSNTFCIITPLWCGPN